MRELVLRISKVVAWIARPQNFAARLACVGKVRRATAELPDHQTWSRKFAPLVLALGSAAALSCSGMSSDPVSKASAQPARFAAEQELIKFGENNPACPMWTDWQRLCSRTGVNGQISCTTDPGRRVAPSKPFCAGYLDASPYFKHTSEQEHSYLRFCRSTRVEDLVDARGQSTPGRKLCRSFADERPFNGRRPAARDHRFCEVWSSSKTNAPICTSSANAGGTVPVCSQRSESIGADLGVLYCSKWRETDCNPVDGIGFADDQKSPTKISIPTARRADAVAVFGVMCTR